MERAEGTVSENGTDPFELHKQDRKCLCKYGKEKSVQLSEVQSEKCLVVQKVGLGKLFDLNPDTALEGLLKLEDKILTFFMETLPKIPQFIASALQSVSVMLSTIKLNIDKKTDKGNDKKH